MGVKRYHTFREIVMSEINSFGNGVVGILYSTTSLIMMLAE